MSAAPSTSDEVAKIQELLDVWNPLTITSPELIPLLNNIIEIVERETEAYYKKNPDPFDDRHPNLAFPDCSLGLILKTIFKTDYFMEKIVKYVMQRDNKELIVVACRLLLDVLPGLETSVVFQDTDGLVSQLFQWAESAADPLQSLATALLAAAMEIQDIQTNYREQNAHLVPIMLKRLKDLCEARPEEPARSSLPNSSKSPKEVSLISDRPFAHLNKESLEHFANGPTSIDSSFGPNDDDSCFKTPTKKRKRSSSVSPVRTTTTPPNNSTLLSVNDCSNSSWAEIEPLMIGSYQIYPITPNVKKRFILRYLVPMGEYQELLTHVIEYNALHLILGLIDLKENPDVWLAFEALKYLAALLCHKKIAMEFINFGGLSTLLKVHRPSVAATGVSICIYYLAYCEDAIERVCQFSKPLLVDLVKYALWLLECSHDSSRCHAILFFSLTFPFHTILELFDEQDGLRKLYNVIATLNICDEEGNSNLSDDQILAMRQTARNVCTALKKYYEAHLAIKADQLRRTHSRNQTSASFQQQSFTPSYKAARYNAEAIQENTETLLELMPLRQRWEPVDEFLKLGGVHLLVQIIACTFNWNFSGCSDLAKSALDVLNVCSLMPKTQLALCDTVTLADNYKTVCMSVILSAAEGDKSMDVEVAKSALNVIINCVCGPMTRLGGSSSSNFFKGSTSSSARKKGGGSSMMKSGEDLLSKMWTCVRTNNGIMILLKLLSVETPLTDADEIRCLACKALCGLSRCETVKQIMSKLPLFTSGQLQVLMREPVLQDKRQEYVKFCKHCITLIERVSGAPVTAAIESSIAKINRAEVVAQTKIDYHGKQLLQLIHQHLVKKGLQDSADALYREAGLQPTKPTQSLPLWSSSTNSPSTPKMSKVIGTSSSSSHPALQQYVKPITSTPERVLSPLSGPLRLSLHKSTPTTSTTAATTTCRYSKTIEKRPSVYQPSPLMKRQSHHASTPMITLDSIVTEYLRKQHSLCKNPVVTCPAFDLFVPHQCPEPQYKNTAPTNIATRIQRREILPKHGGLDGARLNRKFIYSRFRPIRTYRDSESSNYSCCTFSANDQYLVLGTYTGEVKLYNMRTGSLTEDHVFNCHEQELTYIEASRDGKLMITCSPWQPMSFLWSFPDFTQKHTFENDSYMEFSKLIQDKLVGTDMDKAHIYDVNTGQLISTLKHPEGSNQYKNNRATFDPSDELVLCDGVLWDVRAAPRPIHKFDKFNTNISGVFHPNGLEVISNSEVWDLRTFHLLHTVPALNQCQVIFNRLGDVMYGAMLQEEDEEDYGPEDKSTYNSSFRTFDATNYSSIATIDIKKPIYGLATDSLDTYLAIVENNPGLSPPSENTACRLYEIGRSRKVDEEDLEEEEEESDDLDDSDDDDDDNSEDDNESEEELVRISVSRRDRNHPDTIGSSATSDEGSNNDNDDDDDDDDTMLFALRT